MNRYSDMCNSAWGLLLTGADEDFYKCFTVCYDDLYRLGLYLYKDGELVKESIQLLFIEVWKIRHKLSEVKNIKEYVLTIYKRILYKEKTGSVKHWSKIDMFDHDNTASQYTMAHEELLILHQEEETMRMKLLRILPQLSDRQKELIRLRYFEEKNIDEIATLTSLTPRTIYNTLHNALGRLRELMNG